jgi:16S rRNA C967 or C1407 C5-methylase (RsmB/RsmF family)
MMPGPPPLALLAGSLADGPAFLAALAGPFRRAIRIHPRRGGPTGWGELSAVPWHAAGRFTAADADPGGFLDQHTGAIYAQDAASQLPVVLLDPRPGETVVDVCAAPGSKSTQIGLALGDQGLLICCDAAPPRRRILAENLSRQGIAAALVTPMPVHVLATRHPGCADAVLVDAPCSGAADRSSRQLARMAERQGELLALASRLVRAGGRLVYSTCTPYLEEDEAVVAAFLARHPGWTVVHSLQPGCDDDLRQAGGLRLWPQRQGTEPFFACLLQAPSGAEGGGTPLSGVLPPASAELGGYLPHNGLHCWRRGNAVFVGTAAVAACALPSEARGLILGHGEGDRFSLEPWSAQALIERGAAATRVSHQDAIRLWAGDALRIEAEAGALVATKSGAPLGVLAGPAGARRLDIPSRMRRSGLR